MDTNYIIGVDLGGTKIAAAAFDAGGEMVSKILMPTEGDKGHNHVIENIKASIRRVAEQSGIAMEAVKGIGICSPGPLSVSEGTVRYIATLGWRDVPISNILRQEFKLPVFLEKDCNAAAMGELLKGAGAGANNLVYVTVSTGVGGGIIIDKEIYHGKKDFSGEFGHICVEPDGRECSCGNLGCLQAYASGVSVANMADEMLQTGRDTVLREMAKSSGGKIDSILVAEAARLKDGLALEIWREMGRRLGQGISILMQLFDPDAIIIGGSVSNAWGLFVGSMEKTIREHTYDLIFEGHKVAKAALGGDSGIVGAALIAMKNLNLI